MATIYKLSDYRIVPEQIVYIPEATLRKIIEEWDEAVSRYSYTAMVGMFIPEGYYHKSCGCVGVVHYCGMP